MEFQQNAGTVKADRHEPTFVQFMYNPKYEQCKGIIDEKG